MDEFESSSSTPSVERDIRHCFDYKSDIDEYHRKIESNLRPVIGFLESTQGCIDEKKRLTSQDRAHSVDSMFSFIRSHKAKDQILDTMFLSLSLIDRFLSLTPWTKDKLSLLYNSCVTVAMKFEEANPIEFDRYCKGGLTREKISAMEVDMLKSLNFDVWSPNAYTFLWGFTKWSKMDSSEFKDLCQYLALLSLLDYACVQFVPSIVAASVVFLANFIIDPNTHPWSKSLANGTGYESTELKDCVLRLHFMHQEGRSNSKSIGKNIRSKYREIAALMSEPKIPDDYFEVSND